MLVELGFFGSKMLKLTGPLIEMLEGKMDTEQKKLSKKGRKVIGHRV